MLQAGKEIISKLKKSFNLMDLNSLTIKKAREKLDNKEISSVELTKYYLDNILYNVGISK